MTALTFLLWFAFSLVLENGITSSQGTNSDERRVFEYGKRETLTCKDSEIENCAWSHDGSFCTAETGQEGEGDCHLWNNVTIEYSKKECKLTFLTVEIDQGGVYECNIDKTNGYATSSKLTNFLTNSNFNFK